VRSTRPPEARPVFEGELEFLSLPELLHHVCVGGKDRVIEIYDGTTLGHVVVQKGKIIRCSFGGATSMSAFCHLVKLRSGHYRVTRRSVQGPADPALAHSWQRLLFQAAELEDETERRLGIEAPRPAKVDPRVEMPPPRGELPSNDFSDLFAGNAPAIDLDDDETPTPVMRPPDKPLNRLLDDATEAFLLHDYVRALQLYERCLALEPNNSHIQHNIERVRWWLGKA
jgi:hypothetical protein